MRFVFASDSFKGTLGSAQIAGLLDKAARTVLGDVETASIVLADGGEGTAEAVIASTEARAQRVCVHGPLLDPVEAEYAVFDDGRAVIEMASASGITLVPMSRLDPLEATSLGTGELLLDALDRGARDIAVAIGGSATNDGGMGLMKALGACFYGCDGEILEGRGRDLGRVERIDLTGLDKRLAETKITVMCDVDNPLTGKNGATYTYGPQKGAAAETLKVLEAGMCNYRDAIMDLTGIDCDKVAGAGAAGGIGAALYALLGAEIKPGIDVVLDLTHFDELIEGADLIITGEGKADHQSVHGKAMQGVGRRAGAKGVPVAAIVGGLGDGWEGLLSCGIREVVPLVRGDVTVEDAMTRSEEVYYDAALEFFRKIREESEKRFGN